MVSEIHSDGFTARVKYQNGMYHGRVIGIKDVIEFYGKDENELAIEFKNSLAEYKDMCEEKNS